MIYDCFTFFNELDILELRLNILDPFVDHFVIVQSHQTFSGKEKPIYLKLGDERFEKWRDKMILLTCPNFVDKDSFEMAFLQKEYLKNGIMHCKDDDIIYYGDVDEIWKQKDPLDYKVYSLEQISYCYYLNQHSSEKWVGTIIGRWGVIKTNTLAHWRKNHTYELTNGGWHFTNMGGTKQILEKLDAYDHQEYNTAEIRGLVKARVENGLDYVGRKKDWNGNDFVYWVDEEDWPQYLKDNRDKYKHLCTK